MRQMHNTAPSSPAMQYRSRFENWHKLSVVRTSPRRVLESPCLDDKLFFTPELVPIAAHTIIHDEALSEQVLTRHLYRYLDFTTILENIVVNPVAMDIALGNLNFEIPRAMRMDAYKIYCDEAYHALFSVDLKEQVIQASGIDALDFELPGFMKVLAQARSSAKPEHRRMVDLFFVIVSETLISGVLNKVPDDARVYSVIRETIRDHAEDEGIHLLFFSKLLRVIWPQMTTEQQTACGRHLPGFINSFLKPDFEGIDQELAGYGIARYERSRIISDSFPAPLVISNIREGAKGTLNLFKSCGVFDIAEIRNEFCKHQLI